MTTDETASSDSEQSGQPSEEGNDPIDLHTRRRWFRWKVRDNVQAWWEGTIISTFETIVWAALGLGAWYYVGIPFEAIVIVMLAFFGAQISALWRVYVR